MGIIRGYFLRQNVVKYKHMQYTAKVNLAIRVAAKAHEGQYRKGSDTPFITHPYSVALITQKYLPDENVFIAAMLHDVLEDVSERIYSRTDLRRDFGDTVLGIVEDVTEPDITEPTAEAWMTRKQGYINHLSEVADIRPLIVSLADKIHNMTEIIREYDNRGNKVWEFFHAERKKEIWFYDSVFVVLQSKVLPEEAITDYAELLKKLKTLR